MIIGILQAGHLAESIKADHGDYPDLYANLLRDQGLTFRSYLVVDMEFPATVTDCDGWLISGSRHGAYEDLPFIAPLEDFIRAAYAADVPMVGVCFGHQIIAQALGGKVEKVAAGWAVGRQDYDFEGRAVALNAWHQDQVVEKPADAQVCATSDFCENAAFVYGRKIYSVQPHPEFDSAFVTDLAETRGRGVVPDAVLNAAIARAPEANDNVLLGARIGKFFRERAHQ